jgi:hypothetical protein
MVDGIKRGRKKGTFKCKICGKYNHLGVVCFCQNKPDVVNPVESTLADVGGGSVV